MTTQTAQNTSVEDPVEDQLAKQKRLLEKAAKFIRSMPTYGEFEDDVALVKELEEAVK